MTSEHYITPHYVLLISSDATTRYFYTNLTLQVAVACFGGAMRLAKWYFTWPYVTATCTNGNTTSRHMVQWDGKHRSRVTKFNSRSCFRNYKILTCTVIICSTPLALFVYTLQVIIHLLVHYSQITSWLSIQFTWCFFKIRKKHKRRKNQVVV